MINPTKADKIISGILESPNESKTIEFKPSIPWPSKIDQIQNNDKAQEIIMGILGMSNIRDGGKIILGIEKNAPGGKYIRKGMKKIDLKTYDQDLIFDHIRNFGEPEPKFQILNVEYDDKNFIVFAVQSFVIAPVISKNNKNLKKVHNATFYLRTDKPETKKVTDPSEMREIIDLAIEKEIELFSTRMQRIFQTLSHVPAPKSTREEMNKFAEELKDIL